MATPTVLQQGLRRREEEERGCPRGIRVCQTAPWGPLYIGGGGGDVPSRVSTLDGAAALGVAAKEEWGALAPHQMGLRPICTRVPPLPTFVAPWAGVGGAPAHLGAGPHPHLAQAAFRGWWPHPVDPGTLPVVPVRYRWCPEHFRWPNPHFLYIILYLRTIPELLVMSGISSGTPNDLR